MIREIWAGALLSLASAGVAGAEPLAFDLGSLGLGMKAGGRVLIANSRLVAVEPPWVQHRFYSRKAQMRRERTGAGATLRVIQSSDDPQYPFKLKEYSAAAVPEGIRVVVDGGIAEPLPTAMEYTAGTIPGALLAGAEYQVELADGTTRSGRVPSIPGRGTALLPSFRRATLRTAFGTLSLTVEEGSPLVLADRRVDTFDGHYCFWLGAQGVPVTPEQPFRHALLLTFDPSTRLSGPQPLTARGSQAAPVQVTDVKTPQAAALPLLPPPQERADQPGAYTPREGDALWIDAGRGPDADRLRRAAERLLLQRLELPLKPSRGGRSPERGVFVQVMGGKAPLPEGMRVPEQAEGYALRIRENGAWVVGRDAAGAFYGLQTLRFLLKEGAFPATDIRDWPDYGLRGLHLLADDHSLALHGSLIENLMAPLKLNHIVLEVEYAAWDATKELHRPWAMSKGDIKALLRLAEEHFITVTPLVQTLGHCEWLFVDGKHADWAEDPEQRYAYDASNPEVYAYIERLLDEVMETFRPRTLHIGHDEVDMRGRYPRRPANVARGAHQTVLDDILWYHRYAQRRGVRVMMWHDMLVTKEEARVAHGGPPLNMAAIRPKVPRDIILVDWQYSALPAYPEVPMLRGEGFEVIGATWDAKGNIEQFAAYGRDQRMMGMLQTTWTGYSGNRTALQSHYRQLAAYVRAGDRWWNAGAPSRPEYSDAQVFAQLVPCPEREAFPEAGPGRLVDLVPWANVSLAADADPFGLGDSMGLQSLPQGVVRLGTRQFRIAARDGAPVGIGVRSGLAPGLPEEASGIAIGAKARGLFLLHTAGLPAKAEGEIGRYVVRYADGSQEEAPIHYRREIGTPLEEPSYYLFAPAHRWTHNGRELRLWAMEWRNPHPDRPVASLSLRASGAESAPVLLAVSVVE